MATDRGQNDVLNYNKACPKLSEKLLDPNLKSN